MWPSTLSLAKGIAQGSRVSLSRAITLVESSRSDHRKQAERLLDYVFEHNPRSQDTIRVGIAGPPGTGKSTFIESLGLHLTERGEKVAVISIDPTSLRTGGSILGDKTRMECLTRSPDAFIRACPSKCLLGGLAPYTNDVVHICESGGYGVVLVETVGLGQSEVEVQQTVDVLMLMLPPVGGDDLQGAKKGIVEVADVVVVNKADGDMTRAAALTACDYAAAMRLSQRKYLHWEVPVLTCSALTKKGVKEVWATVEQFSSSLKQRGIFEARRKEQGVHWLMWELTHMLTERIKGDQEVLDMASKLVETRVGQRAGAKELLQLFMTASRKPSSSPDTIPAP
ncbi:unnamed protein product [Chrysoparadoxa australica]